jgi:hypothetical protein
MIADRKHICLSVLILSSAYTVQGQWVPVTAKARETVETSKDGKLEKVDRKEGVFFRTSEGSTLRYWTSVNADEKLGGRGEMTDNRGLIQYSVNMKHKYFYELGKLPKPLTPVVRITSPTTNSADKVIEGLRCHCSPAFVQWPDGRRDRIGENCAAIDYDLEVRTDHTSTQNGLTRHVIAELYDISPGEEPDANLFDLQKNGATVFKQTEPKNPPTP